jgi:LPS-assembly protein
VHYTKYSLDNEGTLPSSPDRTVPIFSVDSGLFYEKETTLFGDSMLQTLEPRIYYLNVDEENQSKIPVFDTGLYDFSTSALFRENRFSGQDRIGDANQLSVALTSRLLDSADGSEKLSATLGQIYYFSDRDVTLPGDTPDDDSSSPIIAELSYHPFRKLIASAQLHWDPEKSKTERQLYRMKYQPEDDKVINLAYRYRDKFLKQTDVSFLWPIDDSKRWHAVGHWNYSLKDDRTLDTFGGLEYESCCWKTRLVARRWVNSVDSDYDTAVFFELELKGLGSIGDDVTSFLKTGILGYDRHINDEDDDTYYY